MKSANNKSSCARWWGEHLQHGLTFGYSPPPLSEASHSSAFLSRRLARRGAQREPRAHLPCARAVGARVQPAADHQDVRRSTRSQHVPRLVRRRQACCFAFQNEPIRAIISFNQLCRALVVGSKDTNTRVYATTNLTNLRVVSLGGFNDSVVACFFEHNSLDVSFI